jgi:hypothetical protein
MENTTNRKTKVSTYLWPLGFVFGIGVTLDGLMSLYLGDVSSNIWVGPVIIGALLIWKHKRTRAIQ